MVLMVQLLVLALGQSDLALEDREASEFLRESRVLPRLMHMQKYNAYQNDVYIWCLYLVSLFLTEFWWGIRRSEILPSLDV
jgi:hypothetical protein